MLRSREKGKRRHGRANGVKTKPQAKGEASAKERDGKRGRTYLLFFLMGRNCNIYQSCEPGDVSRSKARRGLTKSVEPNPTAHQNANEDPA